ncbi:MAG: hypothetical protein K0B11_21155 [Mariniphaga sp.]|nr:hypothetical protein [Mariniphaga sp.]
MKNFVFTFLTVFVFSLALQNVTAQVSNRQMRKTLKMRPPREVRREARDYEKDGYNVAIGAPTLQRQLANAWMKEVETEENGFPKYIVATGNSVGETQIAAKLQATEAAKLELAGTIATNVAALIENNIANSQLNTEDAASVTKTVAASKNIIAQELGRVLPLVELYRNIGKNKEANVRIAYNSEMAMELAKKVIRKSLEEETQILQKKLEMLMNF